MNEVIEMWAKIWKWVFLAMVGIFAMLAVVVTIGGFFDIGKMLKSLRDDAGSGN